MLKHKAEAECPRLESRHHLHPVGYKAHQYDALDLDGLGSCDDGALFWLHKHRCEPLQQTEREWRTRLVVASCARARIWLLALIANALVAAGQWLKTRTRPLQTG